MYKLGNLWLVTLRKYDYANFISHFTQHITLQ